MKTSWDLAKFYKGIDDPKIDADLDILKKETEKFCQKWKDRTDYLDNPKILTEALDDYEKYCQLFSNGGNPYYYLKLKNVLDQIDPKLKAKLNLITQTVIDLQNQIQFFELSLAKTKIINIAKYQHFLEKIVKAAPHLLPDDLEKILNLKSLTSYDAWVEMTEQFLSKENLPVLISQMSDTNKNTRDRAAKKFNQILEKYADVAEHELNAVLQDKKTNDQLKKFARPDSARHLADDIDTITVDQMLKVVTSNFSVSHDYYKLKAKLLKVKKLKYHERNVPIGKIDKKITIEHAVELVQKVFGNLDPEFRDIFDRFLQNGQIDFLPTKGKSSGAACWHHLISQPTFLYQNFTQKLQDVSTLAHELGHGINNELVRKGQNSLNFGTPLSTAEVASTFMEDFVLQELEKESDKKTKLALTMQKLNEDISTIFRQVALYNFETELHQTYRQRGYLDKKVIGEIFQKHMASYMGPAVEQSLGSQNWWIYWSHIRYYFYVYSYASGLLISKALQKKVKDNPKSTVQIKEFLSAGLSDSPKNIFKKLNIDIDDVKFWETGIEEIKDLLQKTNNLQPHNV